ncbi:MAG: NUDIX hydrolase [Bacteroidales bacterium]|nr:NUDIX hydrolase [Bacteroidales bacterium]
MSYTYTFPRPAVTVDIIIFRLSDNDPQVLLIKRGNDPYKGHWALPGGFVDKDEPLETAAARELKEETGLTDILLTQMHTFGNPGRDPRGHTVSVVYVGYLTDESTARAGDDAAAAEWFKTDELPDLAFDHDVVVEMAESIFLV